MFHLRKASVTSCSEQPVTQLNAPETANIDAAAPIEQLAHDGFVLLVPHIIQKACAIMFEKKAVRSKSHFISGLSIVR